MSTWIPKRCSEAIARVLLMVGTLGFVEIGLQLLSLFSVRVQAVVGPEVQHFRPDPVIGSRGNPRYQDHDAAGYRNRDRPDRAAVVVLGDSHSYGVAVTRDEAWPRVLEASLGQRVYNMALPGHSPAQSLLALDEALSLKPRHIVVSVYFGNDFPDSFHVSQWSSTIRGLALPDLVRESQIAEAREKFLTRANELYFAGDTWGNPPRGVVEYLRAWLSENNRLYGLMRALKNSLRPPPVPMVGEADFDAVVTQVTPARLRFWTITDQPNWRTILTPPYHALSMDDRDVRVRLGVEILKRALKSMAERTRAEGVELLVVLLPTKETAFWPHTNQTKGILSELVANEARLKQEIIGDSNSQSIHVVDATDALSKAPRQTYFEGPDSHPNPLGHRVIADVVAARLAASDNTARGLSAATKPQ
jgi:hypothetical protein